MLLFVSACEKDKPKGTDKNEDDTYSFQGQKLLVANEGAYGNGNSSFSILDLEKDTIYNEVYKTVNKTVLGDVFQYIAKAKNDYFLLVNNSNEIIRIDAKTLQFKASINVPQPRVMQSTGNKAYVGSLYNNQIQVINLEDNSIQTQIQTPYQNNEDLLLLNNDLWVTSWDTACHYLTRINVLADTVCEQVLIGGKAPYAIIKDCHNDLWVFAGNPTKGVRSTITVLDGRDHNIKRIYGANHNAEFIKPAMNVTKDTLYFLTVDYMNSGITNGLYKMPINALSLPVTPFIASERYQYFWALAINPINNHIFIGDPKGFIQQGDVVEYDASGTALHRYKTGLGPGFFLFD